MFLNPEDIEKIVKINLRIQDDFIHFPIKDILAKSAVHLAKGGKMEIIGRTLANITNENIPYDDISIVVADLRAKGYYVSADDLRTHSGVKFGIKRALISHLICYGEKLN